MNRRAYTLLELLVVVGIIAVLAALAIPAVMRARTAAERAACADHLRQIGLALHHHHGDFQRFPDGRESRRSRRTLPSVSWHTRLLPYLEHAALWQTTVAAFRQLPDRWLNPPHVGLGTVIPVFACPLDSRSLTAEDYFGRRVAFTSYLGVSGTGGTTDDGVLFMDSGVRLTDVADGSSQTVMAGERPPSWLPQYGWWYAGVGIDGRGTVDLFLGVREMNPFGEEFATCPPGPYQFAAGSSRDVCDLFHFWSHHAGGGHFLFADGSVRFLAHSADVVLPRLATRAGGEIVGSH